MQYEKLNAANNLLDQNIDRLNARMRDLQFDMKEYILDMVVILYKNIQRTSIKNLSNEELFLKYLDRTKLQEVLDKEGEAEFKYPADGGGVLSGAVRGCIGGSLFGAVIGCAGGAIFWGGVNGAASSLGAAITSLFF